MQSGGGFSDHVCLFHLAAYISEFRHYDKDDTFELEPVRRVRIPPGPPNSGHVLNGPDGTLTHLLGRIPIEHGT